MGASDGAGSEEAPAARPRRAPDDSKGRRLLIAHSTTRGATNPGHTGAGVAGCGRGDFARAEPIESRVEFEAGPAANNPGPRAVLRRNAPSATRQRTLEQTGSTVGPVPYLGGAATPRMVVLGAEPLDRVGPRVGRCSSTQLVPVVAFEDRLAIEGV